MNTVPAASQGSKEAARLVAECILFAFGDLDVPTGFSKTDDIPLLFYAK